LSSSQRTAALAQERDEGGLEVARAGGRRRRQRRGGALEQQLAVGQDEQAVGVALRLPHVVGGEDHGGAAGGELRDEAPQPLALARVK